MQLSHVIPALFVALLLTAGPRPASAGFLKTITIDGSFSDWTGVPVVDSDGGDNSGGPDIGDTQIANDDDFLYIRNTFPNGLALSTFITIDIDENSATGFDFAGLGLIGSEVGWQNDFPFTQSAGVFNNGLGMSGDFFGSGAALLLPFANALSRELAISLAITLNEDGSKVFPDDTIRLLVWTDQGVGADGLPSSDSADSGDNFDVSAVIEYTLASRGDIPVPEPSAVSVFLAAIGMFGLARRRKREMNRLFGPR